MAKATESIKVKYSRAEVIHVIRKSFSSFASLTMKDNTFRIREFGLKKLFTFGTPVTVLVDMVESGPQATVLHMAAVNIGFGPLNAKACQKRLDVVKSTILKELADLKAIVVGSKPDAGSKDGADAAENEAEKPD